MDGLEYKLNCLRIMLYWDFNSAISAVPAVQVAFSGITEDRKDGVRTGTAHTTTRGCGMLYRL